MLNVGDALISAHCYKRNHNEMQFSTPGRDNDGYEDHQQCKSWLVILVACFVAHLNG